MITIEQTRILKRIDRYVKRLVFRIGSYLHLQLFITLFSWPLLLTWGLPLSLASIIGNGIFAPFLFVFLLLSSLIFFCELLSLPNGVFIILLELVSQAWTTVLSLGQRSWLFVCPEPHILVTLAIPLSALLIIHSRKLSSPLKKCCALAMFTVCAGTLMKTGVISKEPVRSVDCFGRKLKIIHSLGQTVLIDQGTLGRRVSAPSWVSYTLIPTLVKQGIYKIDAIIVPHLSITVFKALVTLIDTIEVTTIYLPYWQQHKNVDRKQPNKLVRKTKNPLTKYKQRNGTHTSGGSINACWAAWERLLLTAQRQDTRIIQVAEPLECTVGSQIIFITPEATLIKKNQFSYQSLTVQIAKVS